MDNKKIIADVDALNAKAVAAHDSTDALKWTQAALNAANAYCSLKALTRI